MWRKISRPGLAVPIQTPKVSPVRIANSISFLFFFRASGLHVFAPSPSSSVISLTFRMEMLKLL